MNKSGLVIAALAAVVSGGVIYAWHSAGANAPAPERRGPSPVEEALKSIDLDGMSPREAMDALYRLKGLL